jgi:putative PIN family toxin of toxin-antitoxin system
VNPPGLRVVIDTNVWISGLLTKAGHPAQLVRKVVREGIPVLSAETFAELKDRLWRPKFDRYVTLELRKALLSDIESIALWIDVPPQIAEKQFCRDSTDDKFIHAALAAEAPWLVTGNEDLLVLSESVLSIGLRIITPAAASGLPEFSPSR